MSQPIGHDEQTGHDAADRTGRAPRRRLWPQSVRVRLTIIATLAFAIAISAAAFGLVRLVHNNLVDRIAETNQQQLNELAAAVQKGNIQPPADSGRHGVWLRPHRAIRLLHERPAS